MKGIFLFFRAAKPLEKGKRRNDNDEYARPRNLGRIACTARFHTPGKLLTAYTASQLLV